MKFYVIVIDGSELYEEFWTRESAEYYLNFHLIGGAVIEVRWY